VWINHHNDARFYRTSKERNVAHPDGHAEIEVNPIL
jgi:anti-sigma factor RsiW